MIIIYIYIIIYIIIYNHIIIYIYNVYDNYIFGYLIHLACDIF